MSTWTHTIEEWTRLTPALADLREVIDRAGSLLADTLNQGGTVLACGNGGSASQASHLCSELVGRFREDRRPLRAVALSADGSLLTCILNDFGPDEVFARQVRGLGRPGDGLVALSTSGRSRNVAAALRAARESGLKTVALLGGAGGASSILCCRGLADHEVIVPHSSAARIQEVHLAIIHTWCEIIDSQLRTANSE